MEIHSFGRRRPDGSPSTLQDHLRNLWRYSSSLEFLLSSRGRFVGSAPVRVAARQQCHRTCGFLLPEPPPPVGFASARAAPGQTRHPARSLLLSAQTLAIVLSWALPPTLQSPGTMRCESLSKCCVENSSSSASSSASI